MRLAVENINRKAERWIRIAKFLHKAITVRVNQPGNDLASLDLAVLPAVSQAASELKAVPMTDCPVPLGFAVLPTPFTETHVTRTRLQDVCAGACASAVTDIGNASIAAISNVRMFSSSVVLDWVGTLAMVSRKLKLGQSQIQIRTNPSELGHYRPLVPIVLAAAFTSAVGAFWAY